MTLRETAAALRRGDRSATDLLEEAVAAHARSGERWMAYRAFAPEVGRAMARRADELLGDGDPPPLCGIPISVKDLYGVRGMSTFAGTRRELPERWSQEGWLVRRLREQGAVFTGKTHTVEFAYSGLGFNPHQGTPWNPWDPDEHRIPGGSSSGAGVSLLEGSALVALGSDTGGSIRIPASMTGTVGPRFTHGRWPASGVVPLSPSMDTVGGLTRSVQDAVWFFGSVDPAWGDPERLRAELERHPRTFTVGMPSGGLWPGCQRDVAEVLHATLDELDASGWRYRTVPGDLLDQAADHYMTGGIVPAECRAFLDDELPEWLDLLDRTVATRIRGAQGLDSEAYRAAITKREAMIARTPSLFEGVDVMALPGALDTPARVSDLSDLDHYLDRNARSLRPTCPVSLLGLCALTLPAGLDEAGMPVGLQLVAPAGKDELLLAAALRAERVLGAAGERLGYGT